MKIGNKKIGSSNPCFVIAEAGVNHNGDLSLAEKLIEEAVNAGADAVKFQTFKTKNLLSSGAPKAGYQLKNTSTEETQEDMLKKLELNFQDFIVLKEKCDELGIVFLSTPFDYDSAIFLNTIVDAFKIPSSEIINLSFLKLISSFQKPIILSTGMCNLKEVEKGLSSILSASPDRTCRSQIALLHCVSNYPADPAQTNLKAMDTMRSAFNVEIGYSDHTPGIIVPIGAVSRGATIIEKHFTLNKDMDGPDHKASLEPKELKEMIKNIRLIESCLGTGIKEPTIDELKTAKALRKSIVASKDLSSGDTISENSVCFKRPGTGYPPEALEYLQGLKLTTNVKKDELITKDHLL